MLKIKRFICNMIKENCYVASDESGECVIIDCGAYYDNERKEVVDYIKRNNLKPVHLVATHAHADHNFGNNTIFDEFGLNPEVNINDKFLMDKLPAQAAMIAGKPLGYDMPEVKNYLRGNDEITFGNHRFIVMETPGHTPGSIFVYCREEDVAFSGDTLFHNSIGRTDLEGGSMFRMIQSLRAISQLPDSTVIYPGHGERTTIEAEVAINPYLDR